MNNTQEFSFSKSIIESILESLTINKNFESWNYCIRRMLRLFGQTTKQPLNNFVPQKPCKYKQFWVLDLILVA